MDLLINASTLTGTGVTQVATSFITECIEFPENNYFIFISKSVYDNIVLDEFPNNFKFFIFNKSPLRSIKSFLRCKRLSKKVHPDCVFSVFGPSYWTPDVPHLMGYAYPHYVYPESPLFKQISIRERLKIGLYKKLHQYFLRRNGKYYVCETEDTSNRLSKYLNIRRDRIFTVSNTFNKDLFINNAPIHSESNEFKLLSLCSPYAHKNLGIINDVIKELNNRSISGFKFIVTIDDLSFDRLFSDEAKKYIENRGYIRIKDCPQLYKECDAIFLPTLLECFSANYPEAMAMQKPILTSNLSFARVVCKDAAVYFDPLNPIDIADTIKKLIESPSLYNNLVKKGLEVVKDFPSSTERAKEYLKICRYISRHDNQ